LRSPWTAALVGHFPEAIQVSAVGTGSQSAEF